MSKGEMNQRGAVLVVVLWLVALVAVSAGAFTTMVRLESQRTRNMVEAAIARAWLDAGLAHAVARLVHPDPAVRWLTDGRPYWVEETGGRLTVRIMAEDGRLDLNRASPERLTAVIGAVLKDSGQRLADAILALRNRRPLPTVQALAGLRELSAEDYGELFPLVTVHNALPQGGVSVRTAPMSLLQAWPGLTSQDLEAVKLWRSAPGQDVPTDRRQRWIMAGLVIDSEPEVFTVQVEVATDDAVRSSAQAVLWIPPKEPAAFRILEWREPAPAEGRSG